MSLPRTAWIPVVVAVLALAPFVDKAFTMDDPVFLLEARHALTDPLHPTAFSMAWNTDVPERVSTMVPSGPLAGWVLVPAILAGGSERVAHLTQLVLLAAAALATASLAVRLGLAPAWASAAGVLLVTTPAALGMAGTAMPDVPAMALGVLGTERLAAWRDEGGWGRGCAGGLLLGLAPLARSHLGALFVVGPALLAGDALLAPGRLRALARRAWPFALAAAVTVALLLLARDPAPGSGDITSAAGELSSLDKIPFNALSFATGWALATTFAGAWFALRLRAASRRWWILAAACIAFAVARALDPAHVTTWAVPVGGIAVTAIADVLLDAWDRRDATQLALGAWLLIALPVVVYHHFPAKYLVASAPAAAILVARLAQRTPTAGRWIVGVAATVGLVLGMAIVRADAAFAEVARSGVRRVLTPEVTAGRNVWFDGHWGFQWYAERAGARYWAAGAVDQPRPGDLILTSAIRPDEPGEQYGALVHVFRFEDRSPGGRIMSFASGAGFFSNAFGLLPWAWGTDLVDAVDVWIAPGGALPYPSFAGAMERPAGR